MHNVPPRGRPGLALPGASGTVYSVLDRIIEWAFAVCFGLTGLSHLLNPGLWAEGLTALCRNRWGGFIIAGYTLPIALLGVLGHSWLPGIGLVVPILGAGMLLKCIVYALRPQTPAKWGREGWLTPAKISAAGVLSLVIAAVCVVAAVTPLATE